MRGRGSLERRSSAWRAPRWRDAAALVVLALSCGSGCGPTVLWRARSPDLRHRIEVVAEGGRARAMVDDVPGDFYDAIAAGSAVFTPEGAHLAVRSGADWRIVGPRGAGPAFLEVALPLRVVDGSVLYSAADRDGWHVVRDADVGPAFAAEATEIVALPGGRVAYVGRGSASERVVVDGAAGAPFDDVRLLTFGDDGAQIVYAGRIAGEDHVVVADGSMSAFEEVLELAVAADAPAHAAIVGAGDACELLHARPEPPGGGSSLVTLGTAPLLSHLRISDDGLHVACLSSAPDGQSIEVWLDGASIARHRRVEGARLAFVPGQARLVWLAEDAQGLVVHDGSAATERFEEVEGPHVVRDRVGFIGRRDGHSEVWIDGALVGGEPYATALRLGPGTHHAFVARTPIGRFIVTRRGRWPVPRFFVDTLVLDPSGEHWAALVPDAAERTLAVWVDGEERAAVGAEELLGPAVLSGADPTEVLATAVDAVLRAFLARAGATDE